VFSVQWFSVQVVLYKKEIPNLRFFTDHQQLPTASFLVFSVQW